MLSWSCSFKKLVASFSLLITIKKHKFSFTRVAVSTYFDSRMQPNKNVRQVRTVSQWKLDSVGMPNQGTLPQSEIHKSEYFVKELVNKLLTYFLFLDGLNDGWWLTHCHQTYLTWIRRIVYLYVLLDLNRKIINYAMMTQLPSNNSIVFEFSFNLRETPQLVSLT